MERRIVAFVTALMFLWQSSLGLFIGVFVNPGEASAVTYYAQSTAVLEDLKVDDIIEKDTILMTGNTKSMYFVYVNNRDSVLETKKNAKISVPHKFRKNNFKVQKIVDVSSRLLVYLETYDGPLNVITNKDFMDIIKTQDDIKLTDYVSVSEPIIIDDGRTHTIDLNGYEIERTGLSEIDVDGSVFEVDNGSKLIINDTSDGKDGAILGGKSTTGGGVSVRNGAKFVMSGGSIKNCYGKRGGAIFIDEGKVTLDDVNLMENNVSKDGKPQLDDKARTNKGGAIYIGSDSSCEINNCTIKNNYSGVGGALYNDGALDIKDSEITKNGVVEDNSGGGILNYGELNIENTRVSYNTAEEGGGIANTGEMTVESCVFTHNSATKNGGGIINRSYDGNSKFVFSGKNKITYNTADEGGGMYIQGSKGKLDKSVIKNIEFSYNRSEYFGGALFIDSWSKPTEIKDVTMENNTSKVSAGAIYAAAETIIEDSIIRLNSAEENSGAIKVENAKLRLKSVEIQENTSSLKGAGVYVIGNEGEVILEGGKTIVNLNKTIKASNGESNNSNLAFDKVPKIRVKGKIEEKSMIGITIYENFTNKTITKDYGDYNSKPIYEYFYYDTRDHKVKLDDELTEVEVIKRAVESAKGYKIKVQISVTDDADDWDDAHVEIYGKKTNGLGESKVIHSTSDIKGYIDHEPSNKGDINYDSGEIDCGDTFPSKINVYANFGGGGILRVWEADVIIWINGVNCGKTHIRRKLWGNTAKKGEADNWITIGGDKYPYPEEVDIDQKRVIDPLDPDSDKVSLTMVDQYGVTFKAASKDNVKIKNVSFPDEDTFKSLNDNGLKWSFHTSKTKEIHNSVYKISFKTGSNVYPWYEIPIMVRFTTVLNMKVRVGNEEDGYKTVIEKKGHQNDTIDFKKPDLGKGYKLDRLTTNGSCMIEEMEDEDKYNFTFISQDIVVTFETKPIKYKIQFESNVKKKSDVSGNMSKQPAYYNQEVVLTRNTFTSNAGYKFAGWNTDKNGRGKSYDDEQVVKNLSSTQGEVVKLYAQWVDERGNSVTASLFSDGTMGIWFGAALLVGAVIVFFGSTIAVRKRR